MRWTLADDRRQLTMAFDEPGGTRWIVLGWDHPVRDEELRYALENAGELRVLEVPNQWSKVWRKPTPIGSFYLHLFGGPPTWLVPRFKVSRYLLFVGWLQLAVGFSFRPKGGTK